MDPNLNTDCENNNTFVVREEWLRAGHKIKYSRYNHATITVPGDMFPQCLTTT
jgi:hypothetical protein